MKVGRKERESREDDLHRDALREPRCTEKTDMHRESRHAQRKPTCTEKADMHRENRHAQRKPTCTEKTDMQLAIWKVIEGSRRVSLPW